MTTTVLDILTRAARILGVVRAGESPSGADQADLLQHLQDVIDGLPLLRDGEWADVVLTSAAAYSASDGERIAPQGYAAPITLPATLVNEAGETVPQQDLSRVQVIGSGLWVYSASKGAWSQVDGLTIDDDSPFGDEDTGALAALVAVSAAEEYGAQLPQVSVQRASRGINSFRGRFYREAPVYVDDAYLVMSEMGRGQIADFDG